MSPPDVEAMAAEVVLLMKAALAPVQERVGLTDARVEALSLRLMADVKDLTKENAALRERVAVLETRPQLPGPPGKDGDPGPPGADGKAGLTYQGVYQDGKTYDLGDVVTWAGQMYHCHKAGTTAKPEEFGRDWQLCVKRGRDGKDAK